ncbi:MAG: hypothetical protein ACXVCY_08695 [Pseudobdellovibrionaceae bacterium]
MTLIVWRNVLYKLIMFTGFIALIAVASGANVKRNIYEWSLPADIFKLDNQIPSPLMPSQCEQKRFLDTTPLTPNKKKHDVCINNNQP